MDAWEMVAGWGPCPSEPGAPGCPRGRPKPRGRGGPGRGPGSAVPFRWLLNERLGAAVLKPPGLEGMTFGWEGAASGPKGSPLPHPWPGSLYLRSRDGFTVRSHHPGSDSAAGCQTQRAGPQRRPGSHPRTPPTLVPPGRSLAHPGHPAPSVPAQEVRTRRGEPLTSWRRTHRGTVGQILMERAFRMGEMWREGWDRRGASRLGQKAPQVQGRTRSPRVKQRLFLSLHSPFL